jgi:phage baseplate assembly protein W
MPSTPDIPKLAFPFAPETYHSQDSDAGVFDCVEVLLRTEIGSREEVPDYGIPDPVFREGGMDLEGTIAIIEEWEPRAPVHISRTSLVDLTDRVRVAFIEEDLHGS